MYSQVFSEGDETVGTNSSLPTIDQDSMDSSQLKVGSCSCLHPDHILPPRRRSSPSRLRQPVLSNLSSWRRRSVEKLYFVHIFTQMPMEPPQHLNGSNKSAPFDPVVQQEMEVSGGLWSS